MARAVSELVNRAKNGDRAAFDDLVRVTHADTYALAYRLTGNEDDASDVLQDAYLRAYRAIKSFRGEAAFTTWLYRITANCAATHLARRGRTRHEALADDAPFPDERPAADPEAMADASVERARVTAALAALPDRLRVVVVLADVYDLPHEVIAAELGISEGASKVRLHRGRRKLRERLFPTREERQEMEQARAV